MWKGLRDTAAPHVDEICEALRFIEDTVAMYSTAQDERDAEIQAARAVNMYDVIGRRDVVAKFEEHFKPMVITG